MLFLKLESEEDLLSLIENEVQESLHLDYKAGEALDKNNRNRAEISKDVSAFANSDGGQIIYGIQEEAHLPTYLKGVELRPGLREWIDQIINTSIEPRISGIRIVPIHIRDGTHAFVVTIPPSHTAHQASDRRYWKRTEFTTHAMHDYELKQTIDRGNKPLLKIDIPKDAKKRQIIDPQPIVLFIRNVGRISAKYPQIHIYLPKDWLPMHERSWSIDQTPTLISEPPHRDVVHFSLDWENEEYLIHPGKEFGISGFSNSSLKLGTHVFQGKKESALGYYEIYAENMVPQYGEIKLDVDGDMFQIEVTDNSQGEKL